MEINIEKTLLLREETDGTSADKKEYITESKNEVSGFINKFGETIYIKFKDNEDVIRNLGYSTDLSWHTAHTDKIDMFMILNDAISKKQYDSVGEMHNNSKLLAENDFFKVYKIYDWQTAVNLGDNTEWCVAGRFNTDGRVKLSQAKYYFNSLHKGNYKAFYYCMPKTEEFEKYCICATKDNSWSVWDSSDDDSIIAPEEIPLFEDSEIGFNYNWLNFD